MGRLGRLLRNVYRAFDKAPQQYLALRLTYAGAMTWSIASGMLTTTVVGGPGQGLLIDLSTYTLSGLVSYLAGQAGYSIAYLDSTRSGRSALSLIDAAGNTSASNGDHLYAYDSLLWSYFGAIGKQIDDAEVQVALAPSMMSVPTSEGIWLDEIGSYYAVPRNPGETDSAYGVRIVATVIKPKCNNHSIAALVETLTGLSGVLVKDVTVYGPMFPVHDGSIAHNGVYKHNASAIPIYGLFDIVYSTPQALTLLPAQLQQVRRLVEGFRAGGTHLRNQVVTLQGSLLTSSGVSLITLSGVPLAATQIVIDRPTGLGSSSGGGVGAATGGILVVS